MKTALLITYHWPPSGGAGVHRWLKMAKYLPDSDWRLIIFTPENAEMPVEDDSLLQEVPEIHRLLQNTIWEPYGIYKAITGRRSKDRVYSGFIRETGRRSIIDGLSIWLRGNLFVPDPRRFWIKPSVRFLSSYLSQNPVDAIISTGPPHSTHLIAKPLVESLGIPWVADFRDPWTGIDYYSQLKLTAAADRWHRRLELGVLSSAHRVVTVTPSWARHLKEICGRHIDVIPNGFDPANFTPETTPLDDAFSICHFGSMNRDRNPISLWQALARLNQLRHPLTKILRVKLYGPVDHEIFQSVEEYGVDKFVDVVNYLPHSEAIQKMRASHLLLLPINNTPNLMGIVPGKFYEYLAARRPILLIGPLEGDAAQILKETRAGKIVDFEDSDAAVKALEEFYQARSNAPGMWSDIDRYSRRNLAVAYSMLLDEMIAF